MEFLATSGLYLVSFLLVLTLVVYIHEFGHYIVARMNGIKVEAFSIGFGPEIFGWTNKAGMRWKFCWIPLGGYVKMYGDADAASTGAEKSATEYTEDEKSQMLHYKSVGARAAVAAAGPIANFLFAIVIFAGLFLFVGKPTTAPFVGEIQAGSAAEQAGLQVDDKFIRVDGHAIKAFEDILLYVKPNQGTPMDMVILRNGVEKNITITPHIDEEKTITGDMQKVGRIGVKSTQMMWEKSNPWTAVTDGVQRTWYVISQSVVSIGQMISGTRPSDGLSGPIGIFHITGKFAEQGLPALISFMAMISIALGLINLFPIPALDGGHLLFCGIEALRGKPLNEKFQEYVTMGGIVALLGLMVFATWNDLNRLNVFGSIAKLFS
jgi:regulator of sigma E protease